jgi:hypothetical protein
MPGLLLGDQAHAACAILLPDQASARIHHAGWTRALKALLVVVKPPFFRIPDAADIDCEIGAGYGCRVARADQIAAREHQVEDCRSPDIVCVEFSGVCCNDH